MTRFEQLLSPVTSEEFFREYWGKAYLHRGASAGMPAQPAIPVAAFDQLFQSGVLPAGFVSVVNQGMTAGMAKWSATRTTATGDAMVAVPERLLELFRSGATLVLNRADLCMAEVGELCRNMTSDFMAGVAGNAYITPAGAQGFTRHRDGHEVIVLQISGSKAWKIYISAEKSHEVNLVAGDFLYIPNGMEHEASTGAEGSLHLTIGIHPVYGYQLVEELAKVASQDPGFRQPIPINPKSLSQPELVQGLEQDLARLVQTTGALPLMRRLWEEFIEKQQSGWSGRLTDMLQLPVLGPTTRVERRREIVVQRKRDTSGIVVEFCGSRTSVPAFLSVAIDRILEGDSFLIRELPGLMTDEQKVEMVRSFVNCGLLAIQPE